MNMMNGGGSGDNSDGGPLFGMLDDGCLRNRSTLYDMRHQATDPFVIRDYFSFFVYTASNGYET